MKRPILLSALTLIACGGPNLYFDPAPAPGWVADAARIDGNILKAVGQAPATVQVQRDVDLATRDAKNQIAQRFMSKVTSRTSDWAVITHTNNGTHQVTTQNIEVRTDVRLDQVRVVQRYRDENSRSQYVMVKVDKAGWSKAVSGRTAKGLEEIANLVEEGHQALSDHHHWAAFAALQAAKRGGQEIEGDVRVLELLESSHGAQKRLEELRNGVTDALQELTSEGKIHLKLTGGPENVHEDVVRNLKEFLGEQGFVVVRDGEGAKMRIAVELDQRFLRQEEVAGRTEHIHAALGILRVYEGDGTEVPKLSVTLEGEAYTERATDAAAGAAKALRLAGETLAAKFRSRFRRHMRGS